MTRFEIVSQIIYNNELTTNSSCDKIDGKQAFLTSVKAKAFEFIELSKTTYDNLTEEVGALKISR